METPMLRTLALLVPALLFTACDAGDLTRDATSAVVGLTVETGKGLLSGTRSPARGGHRRPAGGEGEGVIGVRRLRPADRRGTRRRAGPRRSVTPERSLRPRRAA
jgi:hypothetical protein